MARWAGQRAEPAPPGRVLADGDREASRPAVRFDPLIHPVAITGRCVIGDQIRVPAAWCAVAGCQAAFADPAALGEADNRARAVASGWAKVEKTSGASRFVAYGVLNDQANSDGSYIPMSLP